MNSWPSHPHDARAPRAPDAVAALSGKVAEEIGTALTAIDVAMHRLERRIPESLRADGEASEIAIVRGQTLRLARLARNLLELARPPLASPVRLELNHEVERTVRPMQAVLARRGVDLRFLPWPTAVEVRGDPHRLREALISLLGNAEQASRVSRADATMRPSWIEVQVCATPQGGGEIRIRDSGPGIAEGDEERVFTPFLSGWGGEGMGLSISRLCALGQGGTLCVERDRMGESAFVLRLESALEEAHR
jgi:signal transduction histidine kinase